MDVLYAPWRTSYTNDRTAPTRKENSTSEECVFCQQFAQPNDQQHFILQRLNHCAIVLNLFPYNPGHIMVIPFQHGSSMENLPAQTQQEIMSTLTRCSTILLKELGAHGINIGLNIGKVAGAGIPSHLHWHLVPRWPNDTNFMAVIAETKVNSLNLHDIYQKLKVNFI